MKTRLLAITSILFISAYCFSQTIWNGPITNFTKADFAVWTLEANQDRITTNVWITRANTQGIFNIQTESDYDKAGHSSPDDTEWAYGTTSDLGTLMFDTWYNTIGGTPPSMVNQNMVLHLITDDIYIDIKFTQWTGAAGGGGFSYQRSTDSGLSTDDFSIKKFTITPNPSNSEIKLNLSESITNVSVQVFDILGKEVYANIDYQTPINVSNWEKGIYFVRVSDSQSSQTKQFIKN